jgi:protocatechuate 3,4-dioxygenase beta subunit
MDRRRTIKVIAGSMAALVVHSCTPGQGAAVAPDQPGDLYACEGCEGASERDPRALSWTTRIAEPGEPGERLLIRGRVLHPDGRTPAAGIVIYAYHTNAAGLYANGTPESEWSRRHGHLRGWVRTGADGRYEFRTIKPGPYPGRTDPAHVHFTVLEPGRRPYWIDDVVFFGEPGVDDRYRRERENRGGNGIVKLQRTADGAWLAKRNIVLERRPD